MEDTLGQLNREALSVKLQSVTMEELLERTPLLVDGSSVNYVKDKVVLVTGGGGSIGSELCRQIAKNQPKILLVLDIYENNAYEIEQELLALYPDLRLVTLIASVRDAKKINLLFKQYKPQVVFHAAAHKHVPLMETSPNEAVKNNVFGTLNVARAAESFGAERFLLVSTDKAINPTNVMGATKRLCEMIVQSMGKTSDTKFVAVRFGNVLGSNGSVVPLFKKQIAAGGPITVTHEEIYRYFMTVSEAVSLVLEAGKYAERGEIFALDMGEPIKIYDLACKLVTLVGLQVGKDVQIRYTGLRPGEKLKEERLVADGLTKTDNGLIYEVKTPPFDEKEFWKGLKKLKRRSQAEGRVKEVVKKLLPSYQPTEN